MIVLFERSEQVVDVEILERHLDFSFLHLLAIDISEILIEGVEARRDAMVGTDALNIGIHSRTQLTRFRLGQWFIGTLPQRKQQRADTFSLFHVKDIIIGVEGIEGNGTFIGISEVNAIRSLGLSVDKLAESLVAITCVHEQNMRALFVVLTHHVVGEEGFSTARWS